MVSVRSGVPFDVLVIGSGASGLDSPAAVSAERAGARVGLATKTTLQACNSAKAQEERHQVRVRRGRLPRDARRGRHAGAPTTPPTRASFVR